MSVRAATAPLSSDHGVLTQVLESVVGLRQQSANVDLQVTLPLTLPKAPEALVDLDPEAVFWAGRDGDLQLGLGAALEFQISGPERFAALETLAAARLGQVRTAALFGAKPRTPKLYGGFAFQPGRSQHAPWERFGDGRFVLPRIVIERSEQECTFSINLSAADRHNTEAHLRYALEVRDRIHLDVDAEVAGQLPNLEHATLDNTEAEWGGLVEDILRRIHSGDCTKIVAALRSELSFSEPLNIAATLAAMTSGGTASVFAFKRGDHTFCGASPERLLRKQGLSLATEALAGTFNRTQGNYAAELLRSPKEHEEHLPVKRAILQTLEPLCTRLEYPPQPEICELPHLLHLKTPISGQLKSPLHILRLVAQLHPTPAVGGVPRELASRWIAEKERAERGWYAGPVGYFDSAGDGDFFVALRSGVINERRAFLFAGAGIVSGSKPQTEYAETQLKLRSLRASLRA